MVLGSVNGLTYTRVSVKCNEFGSVHVNDLQLHSCYTWHLHIIFLKELLGSWVLGSRQGQFQSLMCHGFEVKL